MAITRTAQDIIDGALRLLGISSPTTPQRDNGLLAINELIAGWSAERLMVPYLVEESFMLTVGDGVYTIGSTGEFNTVRPMKIAAAYVRDAANVDTIVDPTMSLEEFHRIADKAVKARPARLYYAEEFPLGKIHFDVTPDIAYPFRLFSWKALSDLATLGTSVSLPAEYFKALRLSLAVDLAPEFGVSLENTVIQQAIGAHLTIRNFNRGAVAPARHDPAIVRELAR